MRRCSLSYLLVACLPIDSRPSSQQEARSGTRQVLEQVSRGAEVGSPAVVGAAGPWPAQAWSGAGRQWGRRARWDARARTVGGGAKAPSPLRSPWCASAMWWRWRHGSTAWRWRGGGRGVSRQALAALGSERWEKQRNETRAEAKTRAAGFHL